MSKILRACKWLFSSIAAYLRALPLWQKLVWWSLFISVITALSLLQFGIIPQIKTTPVTTSTGYWHNLWFSPKGEVIGSRQGGRSQNHDIVIWRSTNGTISLDLHDWYEVVSKKITQPTNPSQQGQSRNSDLQQELEWDESPYATRRDGSAVAKYFKGYLIFGDQSGVSEPIALDPQLTMNPTGQTPEVEDLAFTEDGRLAILCCDGNIELRSRNGHYVEGNFLTKLKEPEKLWVFEKYLVAVSYKDSAFVTVDLAASPVKIRPQRYSTDPAASGVFVPAMSGSGRIALANGTSEVVISDMEGDVKARLQAPGPVRALAFYGNDKVVVGGDFPGLYLLSQDEGARLFVDTPKSVQHFAINSNQIVYDIMAGLGDSGTTSLLSFEESKGLNLLGKIILVAWGLLLLLPPSILLSRRLWGIKPVQQIIPASGPTKPEETFELKDLPPELVQSCASNNCVLYAGAGLGAQAGLVTWQPFVRGLLDWAKEKEFMEATSVESFRNAIDAGDADKVADAIVSAVKSKKSLPVLYDYLQQVFNSYKALPEAYLLLDEINFSAILTTNFDNLLERSYARRLPRVNTPQDTEELLDALTKREFFLLKLYGTLDHPETVMVAPAQYEEAMSGNREFSQFMGTLFRSRTLLFVGSSLEGIETYLKGIALPSDISTKHWAFVAVTGNAWRVKAEFLGRRYGIKVLPYSSSPDFREVKEFLRKLAEEVTTQAKKLRGSSHETTRLKSVTLRNIGPFDDLVMEFNPQWNILLGDNAVGKSSILKAIGIALCGERAQPYAGRIIKSGKSDASIVLKTDRDTVYETKLVKKEDEAEVITETSRPLVAEGWLAVGFPPLRTTSWERPKPDTEALGKSRSTPEDILPLVKGDTDPRLDKLKQWIVSIDYQRSRSEEERKGAGVRYQKLIHDLFDVINKMSHPLTIKYKGVDKQTRKVRVEAGKDGDIPIEAASQGVISLISWVGVLMQRFYEVYEKDEEPTKAYALVLMDEIDAHMHPAWQQALVGHLKNTFPNAQFIATTHSPLIVTGMPAEQLFRFIRNEEGRPQQIEVEPEMAQGRADQVLTSELFGLTSSRDLETQELIKRYTELSARDNLSKPEKEELDKAADKLKIALPSPAERKEARVAYELIQDSLRQKIDSMPLEEKEQLIAEVKVQLQETITRSRRPQ